MSYKLPIHLLGLAAALIAGVVFVAPAQAQSTDGDSTYSTSRSINDDDAVPNDNADAADDDDDAQAADAERADANRDDDDRRADDGQDFARSEEETRCMTEFRSFDPATGMYVTEDGDRERCPYLF